MLRAEGICGPLGVARSRGVAVRAWLTRLLAGVVPQNRPCRHENQDSQTPCLGPLAHWRTQTVPRLCGGDDRETAKTAVVDELTHKQHKRLVVRELSGRVKAAAVPVLNLSDEQRSRLVVTEFEARQR